jgi:hypothetical protein
MSEKREPVFRIWDNHKNKYAKSGNGIIEQCTNQKDINGKKIYLGDYIDFVGIHAYSPVFYYLVQFLDRNSVERLISIGAMEEPTKDINPNGYRYYYNGVFFDIKVIDNLEQKRKFFLKDQHFGRLKMDKQMKKIIKKRPKAK